MAFISYTYNRYDPAIKQYLYTLTDSDFGAVDIGVEVGFGGGGWVGFGLGVGVGVAVAKEYSNRGLNVGRNLALLVIYRHKRNESSIADITRWQDEYCPKYIENWQMYAKERDHHLSKLLALA